jgi:septal ring factor EnvC (AmiA/AmiB activator)
MYKTPQYIKSICLFFICFSSMSQAGTPENQELLAQCDFNHNGVIDGRTMVKKGETTKEQAKLESGCYINFIKQENAKGEKELAQSEKELAEAEKRLAKLEEDGKKLEKIIKAIESTTKTTSGKNN